MAEGHIPRRRARVMQPGIPFMDMKIVGEVIGEKFAYSEKGTAKTFLEMYRLLLGLSALSEMECFTAAARIFPAEHAAYQSAVEAGEIAPLITGPHAERFKISFDPELN